MTLSNTHDPTGAGLSDDLRGLEILLVEDSGIVGEAIKDLLELLGADVVGPAATTADAERLLSEHAPDAALVDFHPRYDQYYGDVSGLNHFDKVGHDAGNSRPIAVPGRDPLPRQLVVEKIALTMPPANF
jgi:DNA-binding NarL/FixJ family response regulator